MNDTTENRVTPEARRGRRMSAKYVTAEPARQEGYCVDSGAPVRYEAGDRCIKHGDRGTPCFAALREPRCTHPRGPSNGNDRCQECGVKVKRADA